MGLLAIGLAALVIETNPRPAPAATMTRPGRTSAT